MAFRRLASERDSSGRPDRPLRHVPDRADDGSRTSPVERALLSLQAVAGNAATALAVQRQPLAQRQAVVQRQPKPKQRPAWATGAEADLKQMFPKEKLLQGVVIKDYADLNAVLQSGPYAAWTNSATEMYLKDPAAIEPNAAIRGQALRYILQHEAHHIRQFQGSGPPRKWEHMLKYERDAYAKDVAWLNGPGKQIVTDQALHARLLKGVTDNQAAIKKIYADVAKLKGKKRDEAILDGLLDADLVPQNATADPRDLYKQP